MKQLIFSSILISLLASFITNSYADYTPPLKFKIIDAAGGSIVGDKDAVCSGAKSYLSTTFSPSNPYTTIYNCTGITSSATGSVYGSSYPINAIYNRTTGTTLSANHQAGSAFQDCSPNTRKIGQAPNVICNGTEPEQPPPCVAGCTGACGDFYKFGTASLPLTTCIDSCKYSVLDGIQSTTGGWSGFVGRNHGVACTPPAPAPSDASNSPEYDCAKSGQSYGTVNGSVVCTSKGSIGSAPTAEIKEQPKTTSTPAPTPENPNPTPVETQSPPVVVTTTPPPAGSPSGSDPNVTSSTTNPDGTTVDKNESKESFCKDNPTSKLCKAETQCQENPDGPTCKHLCDKFPDSLACKDTQDFLEQAIGKPEDIPAEDTLEEKEIEAPLNFTRVSVPTANGCPAPLTMSLYGATVVMSFQWLCDYASAFKPLMIAFALMFAATVVMGGVRSDAQPFQRGLF